MILNDQKLYVSFLKYQNHFSERNWEVVTQDYLHVIFEALGVESIRLSSFW